MRNILPIQEHHLSEVARLHVSALAGDFLPSLGERFLVVFYRDALRSRLAAGFVNLNGRGTVSGFVLGSLDASALFRRVAFRSAISLGWAALPALLKRPVLLVKVAETFLYPSKESAEEKAELLVIAVDASHRSQGLGAALVQSLEVYFRARGVQAYKVTVLRSNPGANRFYQRMGFQLGGQFRLYRKDWNLYTRCLEH
jgi:ribosomal protein S18 acetylase RimI-like enzyme